MPFRIVQPVHSPVIGTCPSCRSDEVELYPGPDNMPSCRLCRDAPTGTFRALMWVTNLLLRRLDRIERKIGRS